MILETNKMDDIISRTKYSKATGLTIIVNDTSTKMY